MAFPDIVPQVSFSVGAGDSTTSYLHLDDATMGKLDTAQLGTDNTWADVADWTLSGSITRGSQRFDGVYARSEAGRATLVLSNDDRRFDPTNLSGPYVSSGVTQVSPMRPFRIRVVWAGVVYELWRGFADEWRLSYEYPSYGFTTLYGTDGTRVISNFDGLEQAPVGSGESTGARINRILNNISWPTADRAIDVGKSTVQATNLAQNAWTEILLTSDSEIGEVYFDGSGRLVFRNRHALLTDTRSATSQATFGDGPGELPYTNIVIANDATQVRNTIRVARAGGTQQTAEDLTSVARYLRRTWGRNDLLLQTDAEVVDYGAYVLRLSKDSELRIESITIDPQEDPDNLWPQVLGRELGDRVTVKLQPPGGGTPISRDVFIRGITHNFPGPLRWTTTWTFQDASQFSYMTLDHATQGQLDANVLMY